LTEFGRQMLPHLEHAETDFDTGQSAEEQLFDYRSIASIYAGSPFITPWRRSRQMSYAKLGIAKAPALRLGITVRLPIIG
jgi:hypothetical protein